MDGEGNGLNLQGLAQRLETLTERLGGLERENAGLRHKVAALRGSGSGRAVEKYAPEVGGRVSRRSLLSKAGAAAVAAVAAGTLLNPREAKANHYADSIFVDFVDAHRDAGTAVYGATDSRGNGVRGSGVLPDYAGVYGLNWDGIGVEGFGHTGVKGHGVGDGTGVRGTGDTGVWGSSLRTGYSGVYGQHTGQGYGVVGDGAGSNGAGVLGRNPTGHGVRGEGSNQAEVAGVRGLGKTGVWGSSSTTGYSGCTASTPARATASWETGRALTARASSGATPAGTAGSSRAARRR